MADILFFSDDNPASTSAHRAKALERLGHRVRLYNPAKATKGLLALHWLSPLHFRTGYRLLQGQWQHWLANLLGSIPKPDLIWVNSGEWLGPGCMQLLRQLNCPLVLYNNDDPTGRRDGHRFDMLLKAIPFYDLCVIRRRVNIKEYLQKGAASVMLVPMTYDEIAHRPFDNPEDIPEAFRSEVAFIGTWMRYEKRDEFLLSLLQRGIPLSIWGGRWEKSPYWKILQKAHRGGALGGRDYVAAIQGAKICLGLLSSGNRDLHTRRSVEIPFAGGLLCAQRTPEHAQLFCEGVEAVFWQNAEECAEHCRRLLENDSHRESIRLAGMRRVREMELGNEAVCKAILEVAFNPARQKITIRETETPVLS